MNRRLYLFLMLLSSLSGVSQDVIIENLGKMYEIKYDSGIVFESPTSIFTYEVPRFFDIRDEVNKIQWRIDYENMTVVENNSLSNQPVIIGSNYRFGKIFFSDVGVWVQVLKDNVLVYNDLNPDVHSSGIYFILKKGDGYIAYMLNDKGQPRAVDSDGTYYSSSQAMAYLKEYDPVMWDESLKRARELGLEAKFLANEALVWGRTYYGLSNQLNAVNVNRVFLPGNGIFYDLDGNTYQFSHRSYENQNHFKVISNQFEVLTHLDLRDYSEILKTYSVDRLKQVSFHVGFGGNVYFYVAGDEYTEFFRIRRTWGEPNFYAMAINGYTADNYGKYVDEVLEKLDTAQLRLLRNYIFALYGYRFNSADHPALAIGDIHLPPERQALLEKIQGWERRRGR